MSNLKLSVVLLALMLAAMAMVPCLNAIDNVNTGDQNHIIIPGSIVNAGPEKSIENGATVKNGNVLVPVPSSNLKKITVPARIGQEERRGTFSESDWVAIKKVMTDLSEKEKERLISDMKMILNQTSSLSPDEQNKVLGKVGEYIIIATEGGKSVKWPGQPGHYPLSMAVSQNLGTLTPTHALSLGDYASWADNNRDQPPLAAPLGIQNRHSWVLDGPGVPLADNYGPDSAAYYTTAARSDFNSYLTDDAYVNIGKGLHFMEDMGCPYHTTAGSILEHVAYEDWIMNNWSDIGLDSAIQVSEYYPVTDPAVQAKELAEFSHEFLPFFTEKINNDPGWQTNATMLYYTQVLFAETEKMTIGMVQYANKFDSLDTIGSNSVPINDLQTSYAYINSIGDSTSDVVSFTISHPDASQLEIWVSTREDFSDPYTDYKVWDKQPIGGSPFTFHITATGFVEMHDWRLMVKDNAAGSSGSIDEFSININ